uniref:Uncharacterized protein n=1 Tax=Anguilla anguilla TaxID=7936 RepID=A0A0E9R3I9_ANGAN
MGFPSVLLVDLSCSSV